MAFKDLREFIDALEERGWLKRITEEVSADLEITEITDRVSKMEGDDNVALLFENVKGYDMPVLMNAFGSYKRMELALGVEKLDDIGDMIKDIMRLPKLSLAKKTDIITIITSDKAKELGEHTVEKIAKCKNCDVRYICGGACQARHESETGSIDEVGEFCSYEKMGIIRGIINHAKIMELD